MYLKKVFFLCGGHLIFEPGIDSSVFILLAPPPKISGKEGLVTCHTIFFSPGFQTAKNCRTVNYLLKWAVYPPNKDFGSVFVMDFQKKLDTESTIKNSYKTRLRKSCVAKELS